MISRCYHPSHPSYANYGGRGIDVCERWMEPEGFLADMGDSFEPDLDLDRIDGSRGYAPDNCRWVSRAENLDNRSVTHMVEYAGETLPLRLWAERIGISLKLLSKRLYERGWSVERAFATPVLSRTEAARVANVASRKARGRA